MALPEKLGQVLIVDTATSTEDAVAQALSVDAVESIAVASVEQALEELKQADIDLVLADCDLVRGTQLESADILDAMENPPVLVAMTGKPTVDGAAESVKQGAAHYLSKPLDLEVLRRIVRRVVETRRMTQERIELRRLVSRQDSNRRLVCASGATQEVQATIERIADPAASVLITGETGAGKGLLAETIHRYSRRASEPFMPINCGALQEQLLESELFGHAKGAFTGAVQAKLGLFEVAHGGTLFLDEISEMSQSMQACLLQVLDSGLLRRVGGTKMRQVDARILAATNKDLKVEVREKRFREKLFFRLNVVSIRVPPLRSRSDDIPELAGTVRRGESPRPSHAVPCGCCSRITGRATSASWPA